MPAVRNLDFLRAIPHFGPRLFEALTDLARQTSNVAQQVNANPDGHPPPPPAIDGLKVTGQNGQFHVQIQHEAEIYRGVRYYAEYSKNPSFQDAQTVPMHDARNTTLFLGDGTYYWRAYAAYATSKPSAPAYHGGQGTPQPVSGGGAIGGPDLLAPQGTGTGTPGQNLSGPGRIPFRSSTGAPPLRGEVDRPGTGTGASGGLPPSPQTGLPAGMASIVPPSSSPIASFMMVDPRTLTAASTTIDPPASGLVWLVVIRQDATGGRAIVWGAGISGASTAIDTTAGSLSTFMFAYDASVSGWVMMLQPSTGMTP